MSGSWHEVSRCPGCDGPEGEFAGRLEGDHYALPDRAVRFPPGGVRLLRCPRCRLVYKSVVPSAAAIEAVFTGLGESAWASPYSFAADAAEVAALVGRRDIGLLDIGAAGGDLLRACRGFASRRSALDLAPHPSLEADALTGEFIRGTLDDRKIAWSGRPYDVVTAFDVFEHLYDIPASLENLAAFVAPGGYLLIETGDADGTWPRAYGIGRWWYARLFQHHVFWSRPAFENLVGRGAFELVGIRTVRHKVRGEERLRKGVVDELKALAYATWPRGYEHVARATGRVYWQPMSSLARDHLRVVLRRRS